MPERFVCTLVQKSAILFLYFPFTSTRPGKSALVVWRLRVEDLKRALCAATRAWRTCYSRHCNAKYRDLMNDTLRFIGDVGKRLGRPISDLGDVCLVVDTMRELRRKETDVDMTIGPIEVRLLASSHASPALSSAAFHTGRLIIK